MKQIYEAPSLLEIGRAEDFVQMVKTDEIPMDDAMMSRVWVFEEEEEF